MRPNCARKFYPFSNQISLFLWYILPIPRPTYYKLLHFAIEKAVTYMVLTFELEVESENCFSPQNVFDVSAFSKQLCSRLFAAHSLILIILKHRIEKLSGKKINPYRTVTTNKVLGTSKSNSLLVLNHVIF